MTPSLGLVQHVRALLVGPYAHVQLVVLVRARGGDFVYSAAEAAVMVTDIGECARRGVHGVAIGALTADGVVDEPLMRLLVAAARAGGLSVTFHRAFDVAVDAVVALEVVCALGCDRVLTSGQAATCVDGLPRLLALVQAARGRVQVLPGGGVSVASLPLLVRALGPLGVREYHASARVAAVARVPATGVSAAARAALAVDARSVCDAALVHAMRTCVTKSSAQDETEGEA